MCHASPPKKKPIRNGKMNITNLKSKRSKNKRDRETLKVNVKCPCMIPRFHERMKLNHIRYAQKDTSSFEHINEIECSKQQVGTIFVLNTDILEQE